jgi:hypothetical protein
MTKSYILGAAALAAAALLTPAAAQQSGLVNVDVSNIRVELTEILSRNNVNVQIPAVVQVPIGIAANVCNVSAAVLAQQAADAAPCEATTANEALARAAARSAQNQ